MATLRVSGVGVREECFFPTFCNVDRKVPGIGSAWLTAAEFAVCFVHRAIQGVAIDGGGAGVHPKSRCGIERSDHLIQQARALDSRLVNDAPVCRGVAAIDAASGKVNANVALFEVGDPVARRNAIPGNNAPGSGPWITAQDGDRVTLCVKVAGEDMADLSAAAGYDDFHDGRYLRHSADSAICLMAAFLSRSKVRMYRPKHSDLGQPSQDRERRGETKYILHLRRLRAKCRKKWSCRMNRKDSANHACPESMQADPSP